MKSDKIKLLEHAIKTLQDAIALESQEAIAPEYQGESLLDQIRNRRRYLLRKGVSLNVEQGQMSRIENGQTNPNLSTLNKIAAALGCHLELVPNPKLSVADEKE